MTYTFYKGNVYGIDEKGNVGYGSFSSKKIEVIGDISKSKYYKKYVHWKFVFKNKNEFYILYLPSLDYPKDEDYDGRYGKLLLVKYKKK